MILSGVWNQWSASLGQFHFETDGFRANNDLKEDVLNAYTQANFHHKHSLQGEVRYRNTKAGDVVQRIRPEDFSPNLRRDIEETSYRLGYHFNATPDSDVVASIIYTDRDESVQDDSTTTFELIPGFPPIVSETEDNITLDTNAFSGELQYLLNKQLFNLIAGTGYYHTDNSFVQRSVTSIDGLAIPATIRTTSLRYSQL